MEATAVFREGVLSAEEAAQYAFAVAIDNVDGSVGYHLDFLKALEELMLAERRKIALYRLMGGRRGTQK